MSISEVTKIALNMDHMFLTKAAFRLGKEGKTYLRSLFCTVPKSSVDLANNFSDRKHHSMTRLKYF